MKEHALLLSTEMVLAYLADRKSVTRRIPGPTNSLVYGKRVSPKTWNAFEFQWHTVQTRGTCFYVWSMAREAMTKIEPIYQPGDWLWFRETWKAEQIVLPPEGDKDAIIYRYKASEELDPKTSWRPSIHLPKEACRLWAEVTVCNCERLQDITEEQAAKEGVEPQGDLFKNYMAKYPVPCLNAKNSFKSLWKSIHGPESWNSNPLVYAINFNPLSKTGRPDTATAEPDPDAWKREAEDLKWEDHH